MMSEGRTPPATSRKSVVYALRELGRRAGVPTGTIAAWRVRFDADRVSLYPQPGSDTCVDFPFLPNKVAEIARLTQTVPSRYTWMRAPSVEMLEAISDFPVLFDDGQGDGAPLFVALSSDKVTCRADILTATLWSLARVEESVSEVSDEHGRFPASASAAYRFKCLDRPIVDEYGLAFQQALSHLIPNWTAERPQFRVKLSHDIDLLGLPRSFRTVIGHIYPRRAPQAFLQDTLAAAGLGTPAYLRAVFETENISKNGGFDSAFYWKASPSSPWDSGYDPLEPQIRAVIERSVEQGFESGVHPGYNTFASTARLNGEIARLREVLGPGPLGGRQHYLRWRPATWRAWEDAGLAYDSSVGFVDIVGFRAGTAIPYHPWLIEEDRESTLLEIPLLVMDSTPFKYMKLGNEEALACIATIARRCRIVGGVFTLLWHNASVIDRPYASVYPRVLDLLHPHARYDWHADIEISPLPHQLQESP